MRTILIPQSKRQRRVDPAETTVWIIENKMKRHIALTLINLLLTAVVAQTVAAADSKPNVLFIAIDDLRPEMTV